MIFVYDAEDRPVAAERNRKIDLFGFDRREFIAINEIRLFIFTKNLDPFLMEKLFNPDSNAFRLPLQNVWKEGDFHGLPRR